MKVPQPPKGIFFYGTENGWPMAVIHHLADPAKDREWAEREQKKYSSRALWDQEQNIKFGAGGGERVLREMLLANWSKIVIPGDKFVPQANWSYGAGLDYGQAKPTSWQLMAKDHRGCVIAIGEHYQSGTMWTPARHAETIHGMYLQTDQGPQKALDLVGSNTWADPSIFDSTHAQERGDYVSIADLYAKAQTESEFPVPIHMKQGIKGDDLGFVYKILAWWSMPDPMFKIVLHPRHNYSKKSEGTYTDGCPNLIWELLGIRRAALSPTQLENKNPTEKIVNKNNHAFDAVKYYFSGNPQAAVYSTEEMWQRRVRKELDERPPVNEFQSINRQILLRRQFEAENSRQEVLTYH